MSNQAGKASSTQADTNGLGDQKLCFEIPIYRCNEDKHDYDMTKYKTRLLGPLREHPLSYATAETRFDETEWYPWPYNETIGWIQLSIHRTEIKADLYFVKAKAIRRGMTKRFYWIDEVFAIDVFPDDSSTEIYNAIRVELDKFRSESPYKKWHLHTEAFRNIGSFVDWRRMVNLYQGNGGSQNSAVIVAQADS
jgi:hypothetical protein